MVSFLCPAKALPLRSVYISHPPPFFLGGFFFSGGETWKKKKRKKKRSFSYTAFRLYTCVPGPEWCCAVCQFSSIKKLVPLSCLFPVVCVVCMCVTCTCCVCIGVRVCRCMTWRVPAQIFDWFSSSSFFFFRASSSSSPSPFGASCTPSLQSTLHTIAPPPHNSDWLSERVRDRACSTAERWKITHWPTFPSRPVAAVARYCEKKKSRESSSASFFRVCVCVLPSFFGQQCLINWTTDCPSSVERDLA